MAKKRKISTSEGEQIIYTSGTKRKTGGASILMKEAKRSGNPKEYLQRAKNQATRQYGIEYDYEKYLNRVKNQEAEKAIKDISKIKDKKKRKEEMRKSYQRIKSTRLS